MTSKWFLHATRSRWFLSDSPWIDMWMWSNLILFVFLFVFLFYSVSTTFILNVIFIVVMIMFIAIIIIISTIIIKFPSFFRHSPPPSFVVHAQLDDEKRKMKKNEVRLPMTWTSVKKMSAISGPKRSTNICWARERWNRSRWLWVSLPGELIDRQMHQVQT